MCVYCNEIPLNVYEKFMTRANGAKTSCLHVCVCMCEQQWPMHWAAYTTGQRCHPVGLGENDGAKLARHAALHAKYVMKRMQAMQCNVLLL